jgi:hypothetical protein
LAEAERGDDGVDVGVVGEVHVEGLVEGKGRGRGVEGHVGLGCAGGEVVEVALEAGVDLLDIADAYTAADGGAEAVVAVELEVDAVFEALPFFVGEEVAEGAVAECDCLVGAEGLCLFAVSAATTGNESAYVVGIGYGPVVATRQGLQTLGRVGKIDILPDAACVVATC